VSIPTPIRRDDQLDAERATAPPEVSAYLCEVGADHVVRPVDWNSLTADEAEHEWLDLNRWVDWLRRTYGLPPTIVPPLWHRHDELVWEPSALHLDWRNSYDPDASASAPLVWHRDFAEARHRLREWVAACGTRLDRDRPTRLTTWPGEPAPRSAPEAMIADRDEDFVAFVLDDVRRRTGGTPDAEPPSLWTR
jgi:hypothetical protein